MSIPRLVFAEAHDDQVTATILKNITPKLKALGYDLFLDEIPKFLTREILLKELSKSEAEYEQIKKNFRDAGFKRIDDKNIEKYVKKSLPFFTSKKDIQVAISDFKVLLIKHENGIALKNFLITLGEHNIGYQGIDPLESPVPLSEEEYVKLAPVRDKQMADEYINANTNVFGRVGLAHVTGMQKNIIRQIGKGKSKSDSDVTFRFFHIYSIPPESHDCDEYLADLPLGIKIIDVNKFSEDQIVTIITNELTRRNASDTESVLPILEDVPQNGLPKATVTASNNRSASVSISADNDNIYATKLDKVLSVKNFIDRGVLKDIKMPLLNVIKDAKDTFKPYKSIWHVCRDIYAQPYYGAGNTLKGFFGALVAPFMLLALFAVPFKEKGFAAKVLKISGLTFVSSVIYFVRGVTQMASWPLTLLLRMPLRGIITLVKGVSKIEDSKGLRDLVARYEHTTVPSTQARIANVLLIKFDKADGRGQKTEISKKALAAAERKNNSSEIVSIFKSAFDKRDAGKTLKAKVASGTAQRFK